MEVGIVTFKRPEKCQRLIDSIRARYPDLRIVVADNGREFPSTPAELSRGYLGAETYVMPFDCGLSRCRNFLVSVTSGALLICDDDFEFTEETDLGAMLRALQSTTVVCGDAGFTSGMDNFMLIDRKVFDAGVRWDSGLKLNEHRDFFDQLKLKGFEHIKLPHVKVRHDREDDSTEYDAARNRKSEFKPVELKQPRSVVVLGAGHSGTRIVVKMLERLGWNTGEAKQGVAENLAVQSINKRLLHRGGICYCGRRLPCDICEPYKVKEVGEREYFDVLSDISQPWVIKDPRMVVTLDHWMPALSGHRPVLVLVERGLDKMRKTYERNGFPEFHIYGYDVSELVRMAQRWFGDWPWGKARVSHEALADAVSLFDLGRA